MHSYTRILLAILSVLIGSQVVPSLVPEKPTDYQSNSSQRFPLLWVSQASYVDRAAHVDRANRSAERSFAVKEEKPRTEPKTTPSPTATPEPVRATPEPVDIPATLACIRQHESGGNYQAVNSLGYAGAYQFSPYYKDDWAIRYGFPEYADVPVVQWPPSVQDRVAMGLFRDTNGGAWFDYTTYTC